MTPNFSPRGNSTARRPIYVGALVRGRLGPPPRSTPAYRPVLDVHGRGDLQPELHALSKQGRWQEMGQLIDDDVLHTIAACGSAADVAAHIRDPRRRCLRSDLHLPAGTDRRGVVGRDRRRTQPLTSYRGRRGGSR